MRIGIDISQIVYGTGVSVYTKNLVENLLLHDRKNEYVLFGSSLRQRKVFEGFLSGISGAGGRFFQFPPSFLEILWNRFHRIPIETFVGPVDLFHTSDWLEPPSDCPKMTTVHDLTPLLFPQQVNAKILKTHLRKLAWVKKESRAIVAVSNQTKIDLMQKLAFPEKKIRVIYEGVAADFKPIESAPVKKKYGLGDKYFLAFGGPVRKNTQRVIDAFISLKRKTLFGDYQLVVVGPLPERSQHEGIVSLGFVPMPDLVGLYSGAACLVYPSLYEGFGLPVLEAMACGCPVVTAKTSSLPEVAGKAALLVDPLKTEEIAESVERVVKDKGVASALRGKGFDQARKFSWSKAAKETLDLYETLGRLD